MELVTLRNKVSQELPVPGTNGVLAFGPAGSADDELSLDKATALRVLETYGDPLFEVITSGGISDEYEGNEPPRTIWLANMTGDPDAEQFVKAGYRQNKDTKIPEPVIVENVNRRARTLSFEVKQGHGHYVDGKGVPQGYTKWPIMMEIPPFRRREFDRTVGRWMLRREGLRPNIEKGALIESRRKTDFEPDGSWSIENLQAYLAKIDPMTRKPNEKGETKLGPSVMELEDTYRGDALKAAKHALKVLLLKRIHFRVCNPQYRLPPKDEFQDFLERWQLDKDAVGDPISDEDGALEAFGKITEE